MDCDDDREQRIQPQIDGDDLLTPDTGDAELITSPLDKHPLTTRAELDEHEAIVHGLASYVAGLESTIAGRHVALSRVVTDWADHDDGAVPAPSAVVQSVEIGKYATDTGLSQGKPQVVGRDGGRIATLVCSSIYQLSELQVAVMCEDKIQRMGVRRMLVDAFSPVEWMAGFRLVLPRYHGAVAEYLLISGQQADATQSAAAGLWPLTLRLAARVPVYRAHSLPLARPVGRGTIVAG